MICKISIIFYVVPEIQECGLERIAPLKQNLEGSWIDLNSNEVADLDGMWLQGQPNGKDIQKMRRLNVNLNGIVLCLMERIFTKRDSYHIQKTFLGLRRLCCMCKGYFLGVAE